MDVFREGGGNRGQGTGEGFDEEQMENNVIGDERNVKTRRSGSIESLLPNPVLAT